MKKLKLVAVLPMAAAALFIGVGAANAAASVSVTPATGLADGDSVTATLSGAPAGLTDVSFLQCTKQVTDQAGAIANCDVANLHAGAASGANYTATFTVTKAKGSFILAGSQTGGAASQAIGSISFGAAAATSSAAATTAPAESGGGAAAETTAAATTVDTGTGGLLGDGGTPVGVILLGALGAAAIAGGAWRLARR